MRTIQASVVLALAATLAAFLAQPPEARADRVVITYRDGTSQTVEITRPYSRVEVLRDAEPPRAAAAPALDGPGGESSITIDFTAINRGQVARISYVAAVPLAPTAWLGIVPAETPHDNAYETDRYDVLYVYLKGQPRGTLRVQIPTNIPQGEYEVRIFDSDGNGREVAASEPFTIY
jgi:hypothetical protein